VALDARTLTALSTTLLLWASAFVAIRVALPGFSVAGLSLGRLLIASAALAVVAPLLRVRRPWRGDLARIAACGACGMTTYQLLLNAGERTVSAGTASLLVNTAPVFAAVLALVLLREPLTPRAGVGLALGFTGATVMALSQAGPRGAAVGTDALLILGAAAAQALFFVLQKPLLCRYRGFEVTCYTMWAGTLLVSPLLPAFVRDLPSAGPAPTAALLFLGVAPSAIGFVTWAYAQARLPVAVAANTLYLVPALTIGIGYAVLGETVRPAALFGGLLALTGVLATRRPPPGRAQPAPRASVGTAPRSGVEGDHREDGRLESRESGTAPRPGHARLRFPAERSRP